MSAARELLQGRRDGLAQDLSRASARLAVSQAEVVRGQVEVQALTEQIAEFDVAIAALTPPAPEPEPEPEVVDDSVYPDDEDLPADVVHEDPAPEPEAVE